jgi:hypothetical protein
VRGGKLHAMAARMLAQGAGLIAAKLDVIGQNLHILLAQVFGEDAPDFAIADKADGPLLWIGRSSGHQGLSRLLLFNSGLFDHDPPLVDVRFQPVVNLPRHAGPGLDAELDQPLLHVAIRQNLA